MEKKKIRAWVTKWALTQGILQVEIDQPAPNDKYVSVGFHSMVSTALCIDRDIWLFRDQAVARADSMRKRKIQSIKAQIERLQKLDFAWISPCRKGRDGEQCDN